MPIHTAPRAGALRRTFPGVSRPTVLLLAVLLVCLPLVFSGSARAERPAPVRQLDAGAAAERGLDLAGAVRQVGADRLIEVRVPPSVERGAPSGARLLDVSPDGSRVATVDQLGRASATLTIVRPGDGVVQRDLPGMLAAAFAPDGLSLAVIDSGGRLWRLDAETGAAERAADGPFGPVIAFEPAGSLLLTAVSSVEAPFQARLVRFDPAAATLTDLVADELVVAARALADGTIAYAAHDGGGGTAVKRLAGDGPPALVAHLGTGAVQVDISADAARIAFAVVGDGVYLVDGPGAQPRRLAAGEAPQLAPSAERVLVELDSGAAVVELDGSTSAELSQLSAAWIGCDEEC